jgi:hypothetical protein
MCHARTVGNAFLSFLLILSRASSLLKWYCNGTNETYFIALSTTMPVPARQEFGLLGCELAALAALVALAM